jgi:hypothetical protein
MEGDQDRLYPPHPVNGKRKKINILGEAIFYWIYQWVLRIDRLVYARYHDHL